MYCLTPCKSLCQWAFQLWGKAMPALEQRMVAFKELLGTPWCVATPGGSLRQWNIRGTWWDWQKHWLRKLCGGKWSYDRSDDGEESSNMNFIRGLCIGMGCGRKCGGEYRAGSVREMLVCFTFQPSACELTDKPLPVGQTGWTLCL